MALRLGITRLPVALIWLAAGNHNFSIDLGELPYWIVIPGPVHLGGWTVCQVFEETVKSVTSHRQMTWLDNWHYWMALTSAQCLPLAGAVYWGSTRRLLRDPVALGVGVAVAVYGSINVGWPWWGS